MENVDNSREKPNVKFADPYISGSFWELSTLGRERNWAQPRKIYWQEHSGNYTINVLYRFPMFHHHDLVRVISCGFGSLQIIFFNCKTKINKHGLCFFFFPSGPFYVTPNVLTQTYLMLIFLPIISWLIDTRLIYKAWKKIPTSKVYQTFGRSQYCTSS